MACCGKQNTGRTADTAIVLGRRMGEPPEQMRATVALGGASAGEVVWVRGSHVARAVAQGWLVPLVDA